MEAVEVNPSPEERFDRIYRQHARSVARFALRRVRSIEEAEEIVAETFITAWRRIDDMPIEPLPWLYGIARNLTLHSARTAARQGALVDRIGQAEQTSQPSGPLGVDDAMSSLDEADRQALMLTAWEGLSNGEAAIVVGCTRTTFGVRLFRARRRLRVLLYEDPPPAANRCHPNGGVL